MNFSHYIKPIFLFFLYKQSSSLMRFFLFLIETIGCDSSYEPSRRDGSDGGYNMFLCRINKNYP